MVGEFFKQWSRGFQFALIVMVIGGSAYLLAALMAVAVIMLMGWFGHDAEDGFDSIHYLVTIVIGPAVVGTMVPSLARIFKDQDV